MARAIYEIAADIKRDWLKVNYAAVPYLKAMSELSSINDNYYADSAHQIVGYFLGNAKSWKGEISREIKAELKSMLGRK